MVNYKSFFGFTKEPFSQQIKPDELFITQNLESTVERFLFAVNLCAVTILTGDVGSGKSTALRYASSKLHPSLYRVIPVIASTGSVLEILRQICIGLDAEDRGNSITRLMKIIRGMLLEIASEKRIPVLVIDEAQLLRLEVFAQLHTISQFEMDSKPVMPVILSGHPSLIDRLQYHTSRPLASRIVGRSHLEEFKLKQMTDYINHHTGIAGISQPLFSDDALLAIHQGSGGLLRRANILARGALIAAAQEKCQLVSAEHVRIASTEII
jgi:type II secretory pathway predicted ATPase ExeA